MCAMPAYPDTEATRESLVDDYDAIRDIVQLCLDGEAKGDVAKLQEAFHQDARMSGDLAGTRYDVPIQTLFDMARPAPRRPAWPPVPVAGQADRSPACFNRTPTSLQPLG